MWALEQNLRMQTGWSKFRNTLSQPGNLSRLGLVILLAASLLVGLLTFKSYGVSWDEYSSYDYGREALSAYSHPAVEPTYTDSDGVLQYYGPAYFITGSALIKTFGWRGDNIRHLFNFLTFLLAVGALYSLLSRWFKPAATFAASLLFVSQPLLWGHAFINPKDIPFTAFFLLSLLTGLWMVDRSQNTGGGRQIAISILAGLVLGYAISTRIVAPLAGVMVSMFALYRSKSHAKTIGYLLVYWLAAALAVYLTWPYLWHDPINRFLASLQMMRAFPWNNKVLFDGVYYQASKLPRYYLPKLMALQFTEPVLILAGAGAAVLLWKLWKKKVDPLLGGLLLVWFLAPLTWVILTRPTLYDDFRQFLFITPPIFLVCAAALDEIFEKWRSPALKGILILLACLPGLVAGIGLHPYEYVYYNSLAGQIAGRYETDYWATSFREAANYLNENAPPKAVVSIGPWGLLQESLRPDLQIERSPVSKNSDYVVIFTRWEYEKNPAFNGQPVYTIGRAGAVFLEIQTMPHAK